MFEKKKNEGGKRRRKIKRRAAAPDISPRIAVAVRAPLLNSNAWRRDASITLNLPSAFSAVCPLSLFVVAARRYAAAAAAV